jgi:hypothetical protein
MNSSHADQLYCPHHQSRLRSNHTLVSETLPQLAKPDLYKTVASEQSRGCIRKETWGMEPYAGAHLIALSTRNFNPNADECRRMYP